jgi:CheY-like chemotaxis protein
MEDRILLVDDDPSLLASLRRQLQGGFNLTLAGSGREALTIMERTLAQREPFAVVVCDMGMAGLDGIEVLRRIKEMSPDTVRVMLTGMPDQKTAMDAINLGNVFRFFSKPCPANELAEGLRAAVDHYHLNRAERDLSEKHGATPSRDGFPQAPWASDFMRLADMSEEVANTTPAMTADQAPAFAHGPDYGLSPDSGPSRYASAPGLAPAAFSPGVSPAPISDGGIPSAGDPAKPPPTAAETRKDIQDMVGYDIVRHDRLVAMAEHIWLSVPLKQRARYTATDWQADIVEKYRDVLAKAEQKLSASNPEPRMLKANINILRNSFIRQVVRAMQEVAAVHRENQNKTTAK